MKFASPPLFLFTGLVIGWILTADYYQRESEERCRICAVLEREIQGQSQDTFQLSMPMTASA